ncbi:integral membrane [Fusarium albosuccineum]|uniref:Integral membrane n=1 Tax=Fusarium albosuccineum TaxID=1237068 RepID=A0A8H4P582_9HYPO|nr:integral membrane [Fusarium albosuccineum]
MADYTTNVSVSIGVTLPLAAVALVLRLISRRLTTAGYGYEDIFAVIGFFGAVAYAAVSLIWLLHYGLGRPIADGPKDLTEAERLEKAWILTWLGSETYTFGIAFSKFAILTFYWRIFKYTRIRIPIQILSVLAVSWFILRILVVNLQCIPIQALWDKSIKDAQCNIKESTFFFSTVLTHVIIDCMILTLPAVEVGRMHLPTGQKIAVIALFMFGTLVCMSSIFVLIESLRFDSHTKELSLEMGVHLAWAGAETNLAVISASLPLLRPVFRRMVPGSFLTSHDSGQTGQSGNDQSGGVRLASAANSKDRNRGGSSSTNEAADLEIGPGRPQHHTFEISRGTQTNFSNPWRKYSSSRDVYGYNDETND